jgi:phosphatidate cytidylyltransferase
MLNHMTPLQQRLTLSGIGTTIALLVIFLAPVPAFKPLFTIAIGATICVAMWELYQIFKAKGLEPATKAGISFGALYAIAVSLSTQYRFAEMLPEFILLIALLSCFLYYFTRGQSPLQNLSATVFSLAYLAVPLSCMIRIAYFFDPYSIDDGRWWLLYLLVVTKMTDTGGFFIGKSFGKEKLAPYISPKKTIEGALGGFFAAILSSVAIKFLASIFDPGAFNLTLWQSIWLGAGIGLCAQIGDLSESLLKRDGGIKDSNQVPGLGGMLDIVDSLVFSAPLVYIFLKVYMEKSI